MRSPDYVDIAVLHQILGGISLLYRTCRIGPGPTRLMLPGKVFHHIEPGTEKNPALVEESWTSFKLGTVSKSSPPQNIPGEAVPKVSWFQTIKSFKDQNENLEHSLHRTLETN